MPSRDKIELLAQSVAETTKSNEHDLAVMTVELEALRQRVRELENNIAAVNAYVLFSDFQPAWIH